MKSFYLKEIINVSELSEKVLIRFNVKFRRMKVDKFSESKCRTWCNLAVSSGVPLLTASFSAELSDTD